MPLELHSGMRNPRPDSSYGAYREPVRNSSRALPEHPGRPQTLQQSTRPVETPWASFRSTRESSSCSSSGGSAR
eukprot:15474485-Alexandrium_andersonii.AAC.1